MGRNKLSYLTVPENAFAFIAVIYGILFLVITPPFQVADEYNHFYRAFQISEAHIIAERQQNQVGGLLPKSLVITANKVSQNLIFHPENKQNTKNIFSVLSLPLDSYNRVFLHFPNTSLYSPIPYLPQAFGIALGKIMDFSPLLMMYLGRIFNLLVWVWLGFISIKTTPVYKWLIFLLLLTPMSLFQASSLSADPVTNGISLLLVTICLRCAFEKSKRVPKVAFYIIVLLGMLLAISKQAYIPLIFLYLLIPIKKIRNKKSYFINFIALVLSTIFANAIWSFFIKGLIIPLRPDVSNVSAGAQLMFLLGNPLNLFVVIQNSLSIHGIEYINQFIGVLGWLDTPLPPMYIWFHLIILLLVSLLNNQEKVTISLKQKLIIFMSLSLSFIIIMALVYLSWTPVGKNVIEGVQGRYFIPIAPLFFFLFYNQKLHLDTAKLGLILPFYALFSETLAVSVLLNRYYYL